MLFSDPGLCHRLQPLSFLQCVGKKLLLMGESNVGKTEITSQFLSYLRIKSNLTKIFVFEMGPERFQIEGNSIGGRLSDYDKDHHLDPRVTSFSYSIKPPRSTSNNYSEVLKNCLDNYQVIYDDFFDVVHLLLNTTEENYAIIINDFSIFLHLGSPIPFLKLLKTSHTVFVNAYYGQKLAEDFGSNISWREKVLVNMLTRHFDYSILLIK